MAEAHPRRRRQHHRHLPGEFLGPPQVVGIEERDPAAASLSQATVAGAGDAAVRLGDDAEARVGHRRQPFGRAVGRAVVDDDELEVAPGLGEDALRRARYQRGPVVGRDHHADQRPPHRQRPVRCGARRRGQRRRWRRAPLGPARRETGAERSGPASQRQARRRGPGAGGERRDLGGEVRAGGVAGENRQRLGEWRPVARQPARPLELRHRVGERGRARAQAEGLAQLGRVRLQLARQPPVEGEARGRPEVGDAAGQRPAHQVAVVVEPRRLQPAARGRERLARPEHGARRREVPGEPGREPVLPRPPERRRGGPGDPRLPLQLVAVPRAERDRPPLPRQRRRQRRQRRRGQQVVGVEEHQQVAGRGGGAGVARLRRPLGRAGEHPDGRPEALGDGAAVVGRAVVDDDDLVGRPGLVQRRAQRLAEEPGAVAAGDDDRQAHRGDFRGSGRKSPVEPRA